MWVTIFLFLVAVIYFWILKKTVCNRQNEKLTNQKKTATPVGKQPPLVSGPIPFIGAGLDWLKNPKEFLNKKRREGKNSI